MKIAYVTHPDCALHSNGFGHPESADRLDAIYNHLKAHDVHGHLDLKSAPLATTEQLQRVHSHEHINNLIKKTPQKDQPDVQITDDTTINHYSLTAAKRAAGAVVYAADLVLTNQFERAFCAIRPPGHHAERNKAMGFCLFNNVAVGASHALNYHGLDKVAILDFDVHHGNGTEDIFKDDPRVLFCSSFQHPFYPGTSFANNDHIINTPLSANSGSTEFRQAVIEKWLPALERFKPQMIFISAGFDAHKDDFLGGLNLDESDFAWVTDLIVKIAIKHANNRIVSVLEGGYDLASLASSVEAHIKSLVHSKGNKSC